MLEEYERCRGKFRSRVRDAFSFRSISQIMPTYIRETRIDATPETVFAFHERPDALPLLVPPWEKVTVEKPPTSLAVGTEVILVNRMGPLKLRWVAKHTAYDPPHMFEDVQESGPFHKWVHRHIVLPAPAGGAILRDEVTYELPMGMLGRIFGGAFAHAKIDRMFAYRHEVTKRECEREK
jgi:ligand-binding SRPBCC domain-containing protein